MQPKVRYYQSNRTFFPYLLTISEQKLIIAFGSRNSPLLRNEFPLIQRLRVHRTFLFYIIHQIKTKVLIRREDNTFFQFLLWNTCTSSQP